MNQPATNHLEWKRIRVRGAPDQRSSRPLAPVHPTEVRNRPGQQAGTESKFDGIYFASLDFAFVSPINNVFRVMRFGEPLLAGVARCGARAEGMGGGGRHSVAGHGARCWERRSPLSWQVNPN